MIAWQDKITLIELVEPEERVDAAGFPVPPEEKQRVVYFNEKSVGYSEFYKSMQTGYSAIKKGDVKRADYKGEHIAIYKGERYSIEKTYNISADVIELTLTDDRQAKEGE